MGEKCGGKHYWDTENGYCVGCGQSMDEWFQAQTKPRDKWEATCECGARHTVNPEHHSRWCPAFKERK